MSPGEYYRKPPNPGFVGAYNFKALALIFAGIVASSWWATQYLAQAWAYDPALAGEKLLSLWRWSLYQPFGWMVWGFKYCLNSDPTVRGPLTTSFMIAFAGCFVSVMCVKSTVTRRSKQLMSGAEDLHGSARFATEEEIRQNGLLTATDGVYVGTQRGQYMRHNGPEHVLLWAPTGGGKGISAIIPTLLGWGESAVIYDIKGENWALTAGYRTSRGHRCIKYSPTEENSARFNPLAEIRLFTPHDVKDAMAVALMIVHNGNDDPPNPHWRDAATSVLVGVILHVCYVARREERAASMLDVSRFVSLADHPPQQMPDGKILVYTFRDALLEMMTYEHDPKRTHWRNPDGTFSATHPTVLQKAQEQNNRDDEEFSGVLSSLLTPMQIFSDSLVLSSMAESDFSIQELVNGERPLSLYIVVPAGDRDRLRPLVRLFFTILINRLTEKMDFQDGANVKNRYRLMMLIDEFPTLRKMTVFADALSYVRGFGVKVFLVVQSLSQLVEHYGKASESLMDNCGVQVAYRPNSMETAEKLSKMCGDTTVQMAHQSFSGANAALAKKTLTIGLDNVRRALLLPDEVRMLRPLQKENINTPEERVVGPGEELLFVPGMRPIRCDQIVFFLDQEFKRRASIPPPAIPPRPINPALITAVHKTSKAVKKAKERVEVKSEEPNQQWLELFKDDGPTKA